MELNMRFNNNLILNIALAFCIQMGVLTTISAQSVTKATVENKCDICTGVDEDSQKYIKENCRVFYMVCNILKQSETPIVIQKYEGDTETAAELSSITDEAVVPLVLFLDGFDKTYSNVTPKVRILDENKKVITTLETTYFQQYQLDESNELKSIRSVQTIEEMEEGLKQILAINLTIPSLTNEFVYIQVEFETQKSEKSKVVVVEKLIKKVIVK